jgi:hypothetical protein
MGRVFPLTAVGGEWHPGGFHARGSRDAGEAVREGPQGHTVGVGSAS